MSHPSDLLASTARDAPASRLGLHRLTGFLIGVQVAIAATTALAFRATGLHVAWTTAIPEVALIVIIAAAWMHVYRTPGRDRREWVVAESFMALLLVITFSSIALPAQYAAVALKRPFIDAWLAAADARLGVALPAVTAWTRGHPALATALVWCYATFLPQVFVPVAILGFAYRTRAPLWEYLFHFHFCSIVSIVALAAWPAACAPAFYGFEPIISQDTIIRHVRDLHGGTMTLIQLTDLQGIISMPSLHTALALAVTWTCRSHRWLLWPLVIVNAGLLASTVLCGVHYLVDVVGGVLVFLASVGLYRTFVPTLD